MPYEFWILPTSWSRLPAMRSRSSSVILPNCSFTLPLACFQLPAMRSQFMRAPLVVLRGEHSLYRRAPAGDAAECRRDGSGKWRRCTQNSLFPAFPRRVRASQSDPPALSRSPVEASFGLVKRFRLALTRGITDELLDARARPVPSRKSVAPRLYRADASAARGDSRHARR